MKTNTQPTTANAVTMIPLNQLHRSPLNVRKTGGTNITELAASIKAANGALIHNLVVVPAAGRKKGFGVVAGGRRLNALQQLAKAKDIPADWPVPCRIVAEAEASEVSAAENIHREAMHPADEFEAWAGLVDGGMSIEDVAARNGVATSVVRQRLALARVSPRILTQYREDKLRLDQVMALTLTDDHKAQEAALKSRSYSPAAHELRSILAGESVRSNDPRALYVGEAAYTAAGGTLRRDLFSDNDAAYYENTTLLVQLAGEKLDKYAAKAGKGAAWVDVYPCELDYSLRGQYGDVPTVLATPDADTKAKLDALREKLERAQERIDQLDMQDDEDDEDDNAYQQAWSAHDALESQLDELQDTLRQPHPDAAHLAGVVVALTRNGQPTKLTNVLRAADKAKLRRAPVAGDTAPASLGTETEGELQDPQAVRWELSHYLTAVGQHALANNVPLALRALAYQLALTWIHERYNNHRVGIAAEDHGQLHGDLPEDAPVIASLQATHERWTDTLPRDGEALWQWCQQADDATVLDLLAYSTARSFTATMAQAGTQTAAPLLHALGVDMTQHWQPTAAYFARLRKADTLRVLANHGHTDPALTKLKRDALAERAADLMTGSNWLAPTFHY